MMHMMSGMGGQGQMGPMGGMQGMMPGAQAAGSVPPGMPGGASGQIDPQMLQGILLFLQMLMQARPESQPGGPMMGMGGPQGAGMSRQPVPQIQLPQVGAAMGGMFGQKGNMYGQLADLFRDMARPKTGGMGAFRR